MRISPQQYFGYVPQPYTLQTTELEKVFIIVGVVAGLLALGISIALLLKK